jgi:hypothetical protein
MLYWVHLKRYGNFVMFLLIPNTWQNRMQNCRLVYILQNVWVAQRLSCCTSNYNVCLYFTARQEGTLWVQLNILVLSFVLCQKNMTKLPYLFMFCWISQEHDMSLHVLLYFTITWHSSPCSAFCISQDKNMICLSELCCLYFTTI